MLKFSATLLILNLLFQTMLVAQGSVKGRLVDSASGKPVSLATLTVLRQSDTSLITYHLSDPAGNFRIPGIPLHTPCYVVISFVGYRVLRMVFELKDNSPFDLGTLVLRTDTRDLNQVLVIAERPPVRVYKDTIEFNAASFRTLPDALVEDLLRKLPGVDVDKDGNIMVNGKIVNRILVDGKYFFGDDPKMATRNLPANSIEKVQVTDDKEQMDRSLDGDMTKIGKVINLTLKRSIKKGWFGKTYAGGGTDKRYQVGGIANIYRDTLQLSLIGFSNNINTGGFTIQDVMGTGGFSRSGINSINIYKQNGTAGFALNGISFGGSGSGTNTSTGAGFNLNHSPSKRFSLFAQYFFADNNSVLGSIDQNQQFINDTSVTTSTITNTDRGLLSHVANFGVNFLPDDFLDVSFRATGKYSSDLSDAGSTLSTTNGKLGLVNNGSGDLSADKYNGNYSHELKVTKKYKGAPGKTLNFSQTVEYQSGLQRNTTNSKNTYFYPDTIAMPFNQLRRQDAPTLSAAAILGYALPLSSKWTLRLNANYQYLRNRSAIGIYNPDPVTGNYDQFQAGISNGYQRVQHTGVGGALLAYSYRQVTITGGVSINAQGIENSFDKANGPVRFSLLNLLPALTFQWKDVSVQYSETVSVPDIAYLTPVPDSTNPFYILYGNPSLSPGKKQSLALNYFKFNPVNHLRASIFLYGSITDNDVQYSRTVSASGVQSVVPVNVNGSVAVNTSLALGRDFRNGHFIFTVRINPFLDMTRQRLIVNDNTGTVTTLQTGPRISFGFNWNDKVEIDPDYSYSINSSHYTVPAFNNIRVGTHQLRTDVIVRAPGKVIWQASLYYRNNSDAGPGLPRNNLLVTAAVAYPILAHNRGQLKLNAFDIFNQNNNFREFTTGNAIVREQTNVLPRYVMLTFTYDIQRLDTGDHEKTRGQRLFLF